MPPKSKPVGKPPKTVEPEIEQPPTPQESLLQDDKEMPKFEKPTLPQPTIDECLSLIQDISPKVIIEWTFGCNSQKLSQYQPTNQNQETNQNVNQNQPNETSNQTQETNENVNQNQPNQPTNQNKLTIHQSTTNQNGSHITPQHPRTGPRLFLLCRFMNHLARLNNGQLTLTTKTFRKISPMQHYQFIQLLNDEQTQFIRDLYLRGNNVASKREDAIMHRQAHPLVHASLQFDPNELEQLFDMALSGKVMVQPQLIKQYARIQKTSPTKELILKRGCCNKSKQEPYAQFLARIIQNERQRRLNILAEAAPRIEDLRLYLIQYQKKHSQTHQIHSRKPVRDVDSLSDYQSLSNRLNYNGFSIVNITDKSTAKGANMSQNIKLLRSAIEQTGWNSACCMKGTSKGSFVRGSLKENPVLF